MLNKPQAKVCTERADETIKNCKSFKIGKTGQTLKNRFNKEYRDSFENIQQLYSSKNKQLIDELESTLNSHYFNHPENSNFKEGSAVEMTDINNKYLLYIIFTPKLNFIEKIIKKFSKE